MYCKAKKKFGVIRNFLKFFDFQKSLSKLGPTVEDFNSSWFWLLRAHLTQLKSTYWLIFHCHGNFYGFDFQLFQGSSQIHTKQYSDLVWNKINIVFLFIVQNYQHWGILKHLLGTIQVFWEGHKIWKTLPLHFLSFGHTALHRVQNKTLRVMEIGMGLISICDKMSCQIQSNY